MKKLSEDIKSALLGIALIAWVVASLAFAAACRHIEGWASCVGHETEWQPLVDDVVAALGEKDWEAALRAIAVRAGWSAVDCAVQEFLTRAEQRLRTGDAAPGERVKVERAREHLRGHR